jgi:hypothetical protein
MKINKSKLLEKDLRIIQQQCRSGQKNREEEKKRAQTFI